MAKNLREIIQPEYMKKFECIGPACEDTCCAGWRVTVDKDTFKKYRNTNNKEMKSALQENVTRNRSGKSDAEYAKIKMDNSGKCTLLDEGGLCSIQRILGPEYLSNTCAVYPRNLSLIDGVVEKSAALSCPEITRLVLLNEEGLGFIQDLEPENTRGFVKNSGLSKNQEEKLWELRIFIIRTLQNRTLTIENRLIVIGLFLKKYEELNGKSVEELIKQFDSSIDDKTLLASMQQLPSNLSFQVNLCKKLIEYRSSTTITSDRYLECLDEMVKGLGLDQEETEEAILKNYKVAYSEYYIPFMREHEYILENYLVNYVFSNLFPFDKKSITNSFSMLIINFSLIKLHLIGMSKYHRHLSKELIVKLIQSYSRVITHNEFYLINVEKALMDNGYATLAHMVVLVKSGK
ncbi:flagellin lysine-N-methylase [Sporosarcina sp. 179-K 3D1 HS]|uniref:flagellin lysine-N-methylase n=1 Tax=Sporosarcina sp. 179-K 3D1 HS TaxID=3232169 RepID=UPI0039A2F04A